MRIDECRQVEIRVRPRAEQAERPAALDAQPPGTQRSADAHGFREFRDRAPRGCDVDDGRQRALERERDPVTRQPARVVGDDAPDDVLAGERGVRAAGRQHESREIAPRVEHADDTEPAEQEGEHVAETEVVVDRPGEHQEQRHGERESGTRRDDVDALAVESRAGLGRRPGASTPAGRGRSHAVRAPPLRSRGAGRARRRRSSSPRRVAVDGRRRRAARPARPPAGRPCVRR